MENLIANAGQYGAMGLCLLGAFWYIQKKDTEHIEERREMNEKIEKMYEEGLKAINNNTEVLSSIATLIKNNK